MDEQINIIIEALAGFEPASLNYAKMSQSVRTTYTAHYLDAKSEETRRKRLQQIVVRLNEDKKPM